MSNDNFEYRPPAQTAPPFLGIYDVCAVVNKNIGVDTLQVSDHGAIQTGGFVNVDTLGIHDTPIMPTPQFTYSQTETIGDHDSVVTYANVDAIQVTDTGVQLKP